MKGFIVKLSSLRLKSKRRLKGPGKSRKKNFSALRSRREEKKLREKDASLRLIRTFRGSFITQ